MTPTHRPRPRTPARRRRRRRPGRPPGPGRGRQRDQLRRPARGRPGLAERRRRVDPPGRPGRRLRPRRQPRRCWPRSSGALDVKVELSGGIRDDDVAGPRPGHRRHPRQPRHRRAGEPGVGRPAIARYGDADRRRPGRARHHAGRPRLDQGGRRPLGGAGPPRGRRLRPLRRHRRHQGRHAARPEPRPAARGVRAHRPSPSSPPAASPASTTCARCASWSRPASRAPSSARRCTPGAFTLPEALDVAGRR